MKIVVRDGKEHSFSIVLPTGLALNRLTAMALPSVLGRQGIMMTRDQAVRMVQAIRSCRRCHPGWKLVEIQGADGEYVEITL